MFAMYAQVSNELAEKSKELQEITASASATQQGTTSSTGHNDSKVIWIGNINSDLSQDTIIKELVKFGEIDGIKYTPSKGCIIVKYNTPASASNAYTSIKEKGLLCSSAHVEWSKFDLPDENSIPSKTNWIGNVGPDVTEDDIRTLFSNYGTVMQVRLLPQSKCAFVNFSSIEEAKMARLCLDGSSFHGRNLKINFGRDTTSFANGTNGNQHGYSRGGGGGGGGNGQGPYMNRDDEHQKGNDGQGNVEMPSRFIRPEDLPIQAPETIPPEDVVSVINNFVDKLLCKGRDFEVVALKSNNPKISFINPWDQYHQYYKWKVFVEWDKRMKSNMNPNMNMGMNPNMNMNMNPNNFNNFQPFYDNSPQGQRIPHQPAQLSNEDLSILNEMLLKLIPGKTSIRKTQEWITSKSFCAPSICDALLTFVMSHDRSFFRILSVLYLINDILHSAHHPTFTPHLSAGVVPRIFEAAAGAALNQRDRDRLAEVADVWEARALLPQPVLADVRRIRDDMMYKMNPPLPPPPLENREMSDYKRPNENGYYGNSDYLHPSYPKRERFN